MVKDNTLVSSLTDVQFQISRPYNENGETYATLTVMRKSGEVIAKIKVLTLKDGKKHRNEVINMTNRDYLRNLSNEKLAEVLNKSDDICTYLIETCPAYDDCDECIREWLDAKRETSVKKGQIRKMDSIKWLVVTMSVNRDDCLMLSETGTIRDIPTDTVDNWKIVTDETEEKFYDRVFYNLYLNNCERS